MLLPYQLLLLVAMIRAASSNASANGLIIRGQKLYGAATDQLGRKEGRRFRLGLSSIVNEHSFSVNRVGSMAPGGDESWMGVPKIMDYNTGACLLIIRTRLINQSILLCR